MKRINTGLKVNIDFKYFFDKPAVQKAAGKSSKKALSKAGAFIRTTAKRSIRKRKKISKPGFPPSSHSGELKRLIYFSYDMKNDSVVIGPLLFKSGDQPTVPNVLEFGGIKKYKGKKRNYEARPFMKLAYEKELKAGTIPKQWKNSIG